MKKLLSILGAVGLIVSTGTVAVACTNKEQKNLNQQQVIVDKFTAEIKKASEEFEQEYNSIIAEAKTKYTAEEWDALIKKLEKIKEKFSKDPNKDFGRIFEEKTKEEAIKEDKVKPGKKITENFEQEYKAKLEKFLQTAKSEAEKKFLTDVFKHNIEVINKAIEDQAKKEAEIIINNTFEEHKKFFEKFKEPIEKLESSKQKYEQAVKKAIENFDREISKIKNLKRDEK
ncbi:lipoprotein [Mycoplasma putrefaciens]|uniref:Lipoprotein n=1 Tax=Mycoplasma putrefaciens (strain ATCC 15718 / NCTC 10155 / C30 KS-1 / KS-1) TaxID=743965 RepID=A0A7U3ZST4_MYCPK|nr:lipoprotein [Mycoplasma putrefaciens]AEM68885.1 lipoprotein [Mycoplasma putrefaciens KS1]